MRAKPLAITHRAEQKGRSLVDGTKPTCWPVLNLSDLPGILRFMFCDFQLFLRMLRVFPERGGCKDVGTDAS